MAQHLPIDPWYRPASPLGASASVPAHRSKEDDAPTTFDLLSPLNQVYATFHSRFFVGYSVFDWLTVGPRLDFSTGSGITDEPRHFVDVGGALEVQAMLPMTHSVSPNFMIAAGAGHVWDKDLTGASPSFDSLTAVLEIGFGAHVYFKKEWFLAARLVASERLYLDIHDGSGLRLANQMLGTSINIFLSIGYEISAGKK